MNAKFKIENVDVDGPHAYVRAFIVEGNFIHVSQGSELDGVRLASELHNVPNAPDGTVLFRLENAADSAKLRVGAVVDLL